MFYLVNKKVTQKSMVGSMMESYIIDGHYGELKQTEGKIKILTSSIQKELQDSETKRHEFTKHSLVGRFVAKKIYDIDTISLNEYLYDVGLLLQVGEIDNKKIKNNELYLAMIEDFKLQDSYYLKPNLNKEGKTLCKVPSSFESAVNAHWKLDDKASELSILKPKLKVLARDYDQFKKKIIETDQIQNLIQSNNREPIPHRFGSLSLLAQPARYDISAIYDYIGEWLLIEYGVPNSKLLEAFILNGTISKKDIDQFKTLKDVRLDFSIMTLEDEQKILAMLEQKKYVAARNRLGA